MYVRVKHVGEARRLTDPRWRRCCLLLFVLKGTNAALGGGSTEDLYSTAMLAFSTATTHTAAAHHAGLHTLHHLGGAVLHEVEANQGSCLGSQTRNSKQCHCRQGMTWQHLPLRHDGGLRPSVGTAPCPLLQRRDGSSRRGVEVFFLPLRRHWLCARVGRAGCKRRVISPRFRNAPHLSFFDLRGVESPPS